MSRILITIICLRATRRPSIQLSRVAVYPDHYHCRRQPYACKQYSNIHSPPFISCSVASLISESLFLIFYSHHVLCSVSLYLFSLIRILYIHSPDIILVWPLSGLISHYTYFLLDPVPRIPFYPGHGPALPRRSSGYFYFLFLPRRSSGYFLFSGSTPGVAVPSMSLCSLIHSPDRIQAPLQVSPFRQCLFASSVISVPSGRCLHQRRNMVVW